MTPVKDQGQSCYCSAFAAVSCVEALSNLYYNKKLDLDLSEQEAACCNEYVQSRDPYTGGMSIDAPLDYFRDHGFVTRKLILLLMQILPITVEVTR